MTSKKAMLNLERRTALRWMAHVWVGCMGLAGCGSEHFVEPKATPSPYPIRRTWAIVPLLNESGQLDTDGRILTEHLLRQIRQVDGLDALSMPRTLQAMQENGIRSVESASEAASLIRLLNVDGVLIGSITAWDPYDPPKIGTAIRLYAKPLTAAESADPSAASLDYRRLITAATRFQVPGTSASSQPQFIAQVGDHFDAANGRILNRLKTYSTGRVPLDSAAGWRRYLLSMDLYAEFVSHELIRRLFALEWDRLNPAEPALQTPTSN